MNEPSTLSALILAIPIGYYIYIGFTYSSYIGGEVKEPGRNQPRIIAATLAFAAAMYLVCLWRFYDIVGKEFVNSVVYLNNNTDDGSGLPVDPVLNLFTGIMTGSTVLNVIMARELLPVELPAAVRDRHGDHAQPVRVVGRPDPARRGDERRPALPLALGRDAHRDRRLGDPARAVRLHGLLPAGLELHRPVLHRLLADELRGDPAALPAAGDLQRGARTSSGARSAACRCCCCSASATSSSSRSCSTRRSSCRRSAGRRARTRCCSSSASTWRACVVYVAARALQKRRGIDIDLAYKEIPPD